MTRATVVAALGGNALARRGEPLTAAGQAARAAVAAAALAPIARSHRLVITHGNGPQVGALLRQAELDAVDGAPVALDVVGAESEGMVGYLVELELRRALPGVPVATVLTLTEVRADDPAFTRPTKPVGALLDAAAAARLVAAGATVAADGTGQRRVVPSPEPVALLEADAIRLLVDGGVLVIAAGGGGVPVTLGPTGPHGVDGVVDKDLAAVLLARAVGADVLLLLTDVPYVERGHGGPDATPVRRAGAREARALIASGDAPAGSMGPKLEAAARMAEAGGRCVIASLEDAEAALDGRAGTVVEGA